ncbi:S1 family peptidase [Sorangium sp. So ce1389]|uniref:S1 family peptidase n=1 Tax=Sorangium sp. So ce1389 TaxID=3133336 RepID=UPI003F62F9E6
MTYLFEEDPIGSFLEYGLLLADPSLATERLAWEETNLGAPMPDAWETRALTKAHLVKVLGKTRELNYLRQRLHRIFQHAERHRLIEPLWEEDDPKSPYRRVAVDWDVVRRGTYREMILGLPYVAQRWSSSVVCIYNPNMNGSGIGTGFLVGPDVIVTARHVVEDLANFEVAVRLYPTPVFLKPGEAPPQPDPRIVRHGPPRFHQDARIDVAVVPLLTPVPWVPPIHLGSAARLLEEVAILGYPPVPLSAEAMLLANKGEVSATLPLYSGGRMLVLTCQLRGGYSGGPVLNGAGEAIGVVSRNLVRQVRDFETLDEGLGFAAAVPIDYVREILYPAQRADFSESMDADKFE